MMYLGSIDLRESTVIYATDPCYIGQGHKDLTTIDVSEYGWEKGVYPVFLRGDRRLVVKNTNDVWDRELSDSYLDFNYRMIAKTVNDSGQVCFALKSLEDKWNDDNGNLDDIFKSPEKMIHPTTDYASCCIPAHKPPYAGLSPIHCETAELGKVMVLNTGDDWTYPVFMSDGNQYMIFESGDDHSYKNDFFKEEYEEDDWDDWEDEDDDESLYDEDDKLDIADPF